MDNHYFFSSSLLELMKMLNFHRHMESIARPTMPCISLVAERISVRHDLFLAICVHTVRVYVSGTLRNVEMSRSGMVAILYA